jgi:hypothetical protein
MLHTTIGFHTAHAAWPWLRQTPDAAGVWGAHRFVLNPEPATPLDWLVVYDDLAAPLSTPVPVARRICIISEPPGVKTYPPRFLNQFGHVISPFPVAGCRGNLILSHSALPWHFGMNRQDETQTFATLEAFAALRCPDKLPKLSVVCSDKIITPEHRQRLVFLDKLKQALGERVVHFGRGFQAINDKAEAILPYQFHLALENNRFERGWTEKLADAYLGWAFPVFSGGLGLAADFPGAAFRAVDIDDHDGAIAAIVRLLATPGFYADSLPHLAEARRRILEQHNVFALLSRSVVALPGAGAVVTGRFETLYPARLCVLRRRLHHQLRALPGAMQSRMRGGSRQII